MIKFNKKNHNFSKKIILFFVVVLLVLSLIVSKNYIFYLLAFKTFKLSKSQEGVTYNFKSLLYEVIQSKIKKIEKLFSKPYIFRIKKGSI